MKDLLKRILCIVLALTMVVALVACGSSEDEDEEEEEETAEEGGKKGGKKDKKETEEETEEEPEEEETLVGEWTAEVDMSDYLNEMLAESGLDMDVSDFVLVMNITFDEDGTYEAEMDTSKLNKAMEAFADDLWDLMIEMIAEEADVSAAEAEELLEAEGMTKDDLIEEMGIEEMFGDLETQTGDWELDGDELDLDGSIAIIEFEGDEFSIVEVEDDDSGIGEYLLPIVFERV